MHVLEVWRYPVKSLRGERLDETRIGFEGVQGDRRYAIFDLATGYGLTARRAPELLFASARMRPDDSVEITLPDGSIAADDAALSRWLGRDVELRSTEQVTQRRFENPEDFEHEATSRWEPFEGSGGAFQDSIQRRFARWVPPARGRVLPVPLPLLSRGSQRRKYRSVRRWGGGQEGLALPGVGTPRLIGGASTVCRWTTRRTGGISW